MIELGIELVLISLLLAIVGVIGFGIIVIVTDIIPDVIDNLHNIKRKIQEFNDD